MELEVILIINITCDKRYEFDLSFFRTFCLILVYTNLGVALAATLLFFSLMVEVVADGIAIPLLRYLASIVMPQILFDILL